MGPSFPAWTLRVGYIEQLSRWQIQNALTWGLSHGSQVHLLTTERQPAPLLPPRRPPVASTHSDTPHGCCHHRNLSASSGSLQITRIQVWGSEVPRHQDTRVFGLLSCKLLKMSTNLT